MVNGRRAHATERAAIRLTISRLADRFHVGCDLRSAQAGGALRAEAAGVGDRGDERRRCGSAHAAEEDRVLDAGKIADAGVDHVDCGETASEFER